MTIEKLTDEGADYWHPDCLSPAQERVVALQAEVARLAAALEAAEKPATSELGEAIVAAVYATSEPASLLSRVYKAITDTLEREPSGFPVARSRADALQAEVARLTAALEAADAREVVNESRIEALSKEVSDKNWELAGEFAKSNAAESRAESLQARVAKLDAREETVVRLLIAEGLKVEAELATAKARVAELEGELEGDNGLRARNAAGWAIAKARLEKLEAAEAEAAKWRDDAERLLQAKDAAAARAERAEKALAAAPSELAFDHLNEVASDAMEMNTKLKTKLQAVETDRDEWIQVSRDWRARAESAEANVRAVRDLLRKPGCWSEWARECLAVLKGGGK